MARYLYSELAKTVQARQNCLETMARYREESQIPATARPSAVNYFDNASEWADKHEDRILEMVREHMPSGSGFDSGTKIDLDASHADKLVFTTGYHHMNDGGFYDGWTQHTITITPSLSGKFNMRVSGRNRNDIKDYIAESFDYALGKDIEADKVAESSAV